MGKSNGIYLRSDGRWEARYKKGISDNGRALYGSIYGKTKEEVEKKLNERVGIVDENPVPTALNLLILGAGSHGRDVKEIAEELHVFNKISFLDDNVEGPDIIGKCKDAMRFRNEYPCAFIAIGDNKKRKHLAAFLKERNFLIPSLVSRTAEVSPKAAIGEGTIILSRSIVREANIGSFCLLCPNSIIENDAVLGSCVRIDAGAIVQKAKKVQESFWLKSGEIFK